MTTAVALEAPAASARAPVRLRALLERYRAEFVRGSLLLILSSAAAGAAPQLLRGASNAIVAQRAHEGMWLAAGMVAVALLAAFARVGSRIEIFNAGRSIEYDLRAGMLARLHRFGPSFFTRMSPGEVMSRATNDLAQVRLLVGFGALNLVNVVVAYAVNIPLMLWRSPMLTLASLAPYPLLLLLTRGFATGLFSRSRATQDALGAMSDRAQQSLAGVRVVRGYGLEQAEDRAFDALSRRALEANLALARLRGGLFPLLGTAAALSSLIVLWYGGRLVVKGELTVGDILAFQAHVALISWPTIALGYMLSIVQRGRASLERVAEILDAEPDVTETGGQPLPEVRGEIRVKGLSFSLGGRRVLEDVSLEVPAGSTVAVVGRTGSGKSTLAALLVRMLPTPPGAVFLDGADVVNLPLAQLRGAVNLAQQEPFLFSTTIARNIAFSEKHPDSPEAYERARGAAAEAQMLTEAEAMPEGIDTIVGERGVQLSGGQKQRVALGRALLAGPRVLILDDPLSAVDARTEVAILDAIERAATGRTLVLVTHRVAAASRCDQIVVLDEGRAVERGTHAELVTRGGLYARLAERQALEAELEAL